MIDPERIPELVRMCSACPKMCRHVCPTFFAWRSDAPTPHGRALLIHQDGKEIRPIDERGIEVLYQCLECSHCLTWCLPEIDIASIVEEARVRLVDAGKYPHVLNELLEAIKEHHNPFGESHSQRNDWIDIQKTEGSKIAYFTGCTAAYREKGIVESTTEILSALGHQVVVSSEEWCCGSPLLRTGFHEAAMEQAQHNVEILNSMDVESIVVTCPGCYRVLKQDYAENGFEIEAPVRHLSEVLERQLEDLWTGQIDGRITYHDPCHLGRHMGVYDAPRQVIQKVSGQEILEMERHGENANCCGNGAGMRMLFPEKAKQIGARRIQDAKDVGATVLVTACPFCKDILATQAGSDLS
ncbi:MAG: (Fe-S)-binding protein, partial [Candidatus Thorarchaeota archaeon]